MKNFEGRKRKNPLRSALAGAAALGAVTGAEAAPVSPSDMSGARTSIEKVNFAPSEESERDQVALEKLESDYNKEHDTEFSLVLRMGVVKIVDGETVVGEVYLWKDAKKTPVSDITLEMIDQAIDNYEPSTYVPRQ